MNPKKRIFQLLRHLASAPLGSQIETGLCFAEPGGWHVYQRVGTMGWAMSPTEAIAMATTAAKVAKSPEWRGRTNEVIEQFAMLRDLAREASEKNRDGVLPPAVH